MSDFLRSLTQMCQDNAQEITDRAKCNNPQRPPHVERTIRSGWNVYIEEFNGSGWWYSKFGVTPSHLCYIPEGKPNVRLPGPDGCPVEFLLLQ
jgi:hypothetical protein